MIASIIATFTTWRVIFGVQGGMALIGLVLAFFLVPKKSELSNLQYDEKPKHRSKEAILAAFNPIHVFRLFKFPSILLAVSTICLSRLDISADISEGCHMRPPRRQPILPAVLRATYHQPSL